MNNCYYYTLYTKEGTKIRDFNSQDEAAKFLKVSLSYIQRHKHGKLIKKLFRLEKFSKYGSIICFLPNGNSVTYPTKLACSKALNVSRDVIDKCIRQGSLDKYGRAFDYEI